MKKGIVVFILFMISVSAYTQHFAIKNNLLYDATLTPNLGIELGIGKKFTLDISGGYNPFTLDDEKNKMLKHWLVQPELRFWTCERFSGTFIGVHAHGGQYEVANMKLPFGLFENLENSRYEGHLYGGGISIGHQWVLGYRWNLEASIGGGYARIKYDRFGPEKDAPMSDTGNHNYFGITKASISLIFIIR